MLRVDFLCSVTRLLSRNLTRAVESVVETLSPDPIGSEAAAVAGTSAPLILRGADAVTVASVFCYVLLISVAGLQACQALVIMPDQVFIERGGLFNVPLFRIFQMRDRGFYYNTPRLLLLAVRPGRFGYAEGADERR